jgi:tripartite-type tricarboxylate transporter receptor subunit TctC
MAKKIITSMLVIFSVFVFFSMNTMAQEKFPERAVRLIVTHRAGGSSDTVQRLLQPYLADVLGVPVIVENMTGGGGNKARGFVWKQKPDGYQILVSKQPSLSAGELINDGKFESLKFVHIYNIAGSNYNCLMVPAVSPFKTVEDVKKASLKQSIITAASDVASASHLSLLRWKQSGFKLTFVPFGSGTDVALAVAGNQVQAGVGTIATVFPLTKQGKVRILASNGPERAALYPDIPTATELGYPKVVMDELVGYFAPTGLPKERLDILEKAFAKAGSNPEFKQKMTKAGYNIRLLGSKAFFAASKDMHELILSMQDEIKAERKKYPKKKKKKK